MKQLGQIDLSFDSAVERLSAKWQEFLRAFDMLSADYEVAQSQPDLLQDWQSLYDTANRVKASVQYLLGQIRDAGSWVSETFGLSGMHGLSAVPLIPVAVITGAIAYLISVINSIWEFHSRVELVKQGMAPGSILTPSAGPIGETGNLVKWLVIGAALYFAVPIVAKKLK